jgi:hypothetical protein
MSTEPTTQGTTPEPPRPDDGGEASEDRALRELAVRQVERVHSFRLHLMTYVVGIVGLGIIWMLTEYFQDSTWPSRFADADDGDPGTWNPWYFYAVGVWSVVLAVHAVKTYGRRPPTEAEIQREIDRIRPTR